MTGLDGPGVPAGGATATVPCRAVGTIESLQSILVKKLRSYGTAACCVSFFLVKGRFAVEWRRADVFRVERASPLRRLLGPGGSDDCGVVGGSWWLWMGEVDVDGGTVLFDSFRRDLGE